MLITKPLKYTPLELVRVINVYFTQTPIEIWTMTGLFIAVGSRQLFYDYLRRPDYTPILQAAQIQIENSYEIDLKKSGRTGTIFALKNFRSVKGKPHWVDKKENEISGGEGADVKWSVKIKKGKKK